MKKTVWIALCLIISAFGVSAQEKVIVVNEGVWQADNGTLSYFDNGTIVSNQWFRENNGYKLGDTPNSIIQISDDLVAIAVSGDIIQFITPQGKAVKAIDAVPSARRMASDGKYLYVTSFAHEVVVGSETNYFQKGYVAKIDLETFQVVAATQTGYEPEGIAIYNGMLFVANSGGYAFQEDHDYESTVSMIDAATMVSVRTITTGQANLGGQISAYGKYLCISSPGDYYTVPAATILLDCQAAIDRKDDAGCFVSLPISSTYNTCTPDGKFYVIGSEYSYITGGYDYNYNVIDPATAFESQGAQGISSAFPGSFLADIKALAIPYGLYVNPYTGYIYATDAKDYTSAGLLYQWSPDGKMLGSFKVYINPSHFLALPPNGHFEGVADIQADIAREDNAVYNLQGIRVENPLPGQIYISSGKKFIMK